MKINDAVCFHHPKETLTENAKEWLSPVQTAERNEWTKCGQHLNVVQYVLMFTGPEIPKATAPFPACLKS